MRNYLDADLSRILRRIPYLVVGGLIALAEIAGIVRLYLTDWSGVSFSSFSYTFMQMMPVLPGLVLYVAVYNEDMRARTWYQAIARGMTRTRVLFVKLIEMVLISLLFMAFYSAILFLFGGILDADLDGQMVASIVVYITTAATQILGYTCIANFFVIVFSNPGLGAILYLLLSAGIVERILSVIAGLPQFQSQELMDMTFRSLIETGSKELLAGGANPFRILLILGYIVVFFTASAIVYSRKELQMR